MIEPVLKEEVVKAVERRFPGRVPRVRTLWRGEGLEAQYGSEALDQLGRKYPDDVIYFMLPNPVDPSVMNLSWKWQTGGALDASAVIQEWSQLDEFIEKLPMPENDGKLALLAENAERLQSDGRYLLFGWWRFFFEQPWTLRGMENLMCDYYEEPEQIQRLHEALLATYIRYLDAACRIIRPDGFFTSDDLGHQTGSMMNPAVFREQIAPFYARFSERLKAQHLHFWLHSCGNNTELLPDLIASGVQVFHPVQKHTMDEIETMRRFGGKISFLAGIDVQHTLQEKSPEGVRREVRFLIDTFNRPEGGMCIAAGNGITAGTPLENIEAFLDEAARYGCNQNNSGCGL
ncbi:MAG: uroporphyrinogen decarboxylase family protein [Kiritimatiellales bacterium]|jgi:uroporphyrinogen decarboxylase